MPSSEDLLTLQEAIDSAVKTSQDLQVSNALLVENISYVAVHNVSPEAHEDIRAEIRGIPKAITNPTITGPLTVETGEAYNFTFSANSLLVGTHITKFKIVKPDMSILILDGAAVTDDAAITSLTFVGGRFEKQHITIYAYDEYGTESAPTIVEFTITANAGPDITNFICTGIPTYANPGDGVSFTFSGVVDIDIPYGDVLTYSVENTDLVFNKTSEISGLETLSFTVPANMERGITTSFDLRVTDSKGGSAIKTFSLKVNQLPNITFLEHTLPVLINRDSTVQFRILGATDPDNHTLKYSIVSTNPDLIFSKTADIGELELIGLTVKDTAVLGSTVGFKIVTTDEYGASVEYVANTSRVNTPPSVAGLTCTLDPIVKPNGHYPFQLNGASDVDNPSIKYSIVCSELSYVFSKLTNIVDGENLTLDIPIGALRGSTFSITVTATDSIGATTTKVFNYSVNRLIDVSLATLNVPTYIKPDGIYSVKISGVSDNDSQPVTYEIVSDDPLATFSKSTGINIGETITLDIAAVITRGNTLTFTCTFTDGVETVLKPFTTKINRLPSTAIADTIPLIIKPNTSIGFTLSSTDPDGQAVTYSISSNNDKVSFSKTSGIVVNESVNIITAADAVRGADVNITVVASDGIESVSKVKAIKINTLPSTTVIHNIPNMVAPNTSKTVSFSSTDADSSQALTYSIASNNPGITFSKTSGIAKDESVTMFISSGITRGATPVITITISDGLESVSTTFVTTINVLPDMTGALINSLPSIVKPNTTYPINVTGAVDTNGQPLTYSISSNNPKVAFSKATDLVAGEAFNLITDATIVRGSTVTITITTSNGLESNTKTFDVFINTLPNMSAVSMLLSGIIKPNTTYGNVTLSGITDLSAQPLAYAISCDNGLVTFSKSTGILEGGAFDITVGNVVRGTTLNFTITGNDGLENSAPIVKPLTVNKLPVVTGVTCNVPTIVKPNSTYEFALNGASDTDAQALTYDIASSDPKLTFSKSSSITANEAVTLTVDPTAVRGTVVTLTVTVNDGLESVTKQFTTKVNTLPDVNLIHTIESILIPGNSYTVALSDTDIDNQALIYSIASNNPGITFSKSSGIANNESFSLLVAANIERNTDIILSITISDGMESIIKTVTVRANALPVVTGVTINNLPTIMNPNLTYDINITGGTDANAQSLKYAISSNNTDVLFSKASDISNGETITLSFKPTAVRGAPIEFTVAVTDAMETVNKSGFVSAINSLPVTTNVSFTLPAIIKPSITYAGMALAGITDPQAQALTYSIVSDNPGITFSKSTGLTSLEAFNVIVGAVARNTTVTFTVTGSDGLETSTKTFTAKINNLPVATAITINALPAIVKPNSTQAINITGGTDVDAQSLSYAISSSDPKVTFSKSTGITSAESINMIVDSTIVRNTTVTLTVTVSDGLETTTKTFTTLINTLPIVTGVAFTIPGFVKPNATTPGVALSGATDVNGGPSLTYSIACDNGVTFSKSSGLASGEAFDVIVGAVARGTTLTFTVTVSDGIEINTKTFTTKVNQLPSTTVTTTLPAILYPGQTQSITLTSTDPDAQAVSYAIASSDANVTLSKSSGIAPNESFNVILAAGTTRGSTVTLTITISDGLETVTTTKTFKVNTKPVVTGLVTTLPLITKPNSTVAFTMSGATDVDSQSLTYAVSSNDAKITFSKTSGIVSGESVNIITDVDATRGNTATITITVSDGLETTTTTKSVKINTLPSTTITETLPAIVVPGQTYPVTLTSTDDDSQTLSYAIVSSDGTNVTFSKSSGLASGESFNVIIGSSVVRGATITFTVTISDGLENVTTTFTTLINSLPAGAIGGVPSIVAPGSTTPISFGGVTDPNGGAITYSIINNSGGTVSFSKTSNIASGENIDMVVTAGATRGSVPDVTVVASDGLETVPTALGVKINTLPVMTGVTFNLPAIVKPNSTSTGIILAGVTDVDAQALTYSITCDNVNVTFSKSTGLVANEAFNVIMGAITRNTTLTFTITGSDGVETVTTTKTSKINNLPITTGFADTLPAIVKPNSTNAFTMSGVTDADGQSLSYSIVCDKAYVTFSKSTDIVANESINAVFSAAAVRGETATFTVTLSDGLESVTKTFTAKVNTLPVNSVTDTLQAVIVPGQTHAAALTSTDVDGQTLSYSITSDNANITYSKASGLAALESFNVIVGASIVRGATVTFTVTINDGLETSTATFTALVNTLPVATATVINNLPTIVKPTGVYALNLTGGTTGGDAGQTALYSITSSDANVTFSKSTGLASGESFNMTVGASITRNTTIALTTTVTDGLETAQKTFTTLVNTLPDGASLALNGIADGTNGTTALILPGKTYTGASVNGFSDVNSGSQSLTYSITSSDANVTFSKSTGLVLNEAFNIIVGAGITRGATVTFTFGISDGMETTTVTRTRIVNNLPVVTNVVCNNLPATTVGSSTPISVNFTGATDVNNQAITYAISGISAGLTFSKTTGIAAGEAINLTIAKVSVQEVKSFTVIVNDGYENSSTTKVFSVTVNPIYTIATPTIISPTQGQVMSSDTFTFTFDAINVTVDLS